jgi:hypothetical protein
LKPVKIRHDPDVLARREIGPFNDMKELYSFTNKQTSRRFLYHFQSNVGNPPLCLTLFSGGSFYGLSIAQKKAYLRKKATDIDNGIMYTDNEFATDRSKLCFEFDLKSVEQVADWTQPFISSARYIALKIAEAQQKNVLCHLLIRPPKQSSNSGEWKYGMHVVFENVITSVQKGHKLSTKIKTKIAYVDSCYHGDIARLRPAHARKLDQRPFKCACTRLVPADLCPCKSVSLSTAYCYQTSIIATPDSKLHEMVITFESTYDALRATSIWLV